MEPIFPFECWKDAGLFDDSKRLFRPLVYLFEHVVLPEAIFRRHPMTEALWDQNESPEGSLQFFLSASASQCEIRGLWPAIDFDDPAWVHYMHAVTKDMRAARDVTSQGEPMLYLYPPRPAAPGEARQIAILLGAEPRYLLEEIASDPAITFLCEWDSDGTHLNFGARSPLTQDEFLVWARNGGGA